MHAMLIPLRAAARVFEIPKCSSTMDGIEKVFANPIRLYREREILHNLPFVDLKLRGKLPEAVCKNDPLCDLPFLILSIGKIQFLVVRVVVRELLRLAKQIAGNGSTRPVSRSRNEEHSSNCISRASTMSFKRAVAGMASRP